MSKNLIKYKKSKILQVGRFGKGGYFGLGSNQFLLDDKEKWENLVKIASEWKNSHTEEEILKIIKSKYKKLSIRNIKESISLIKNNNFLVRSEY